MLPVMIVLPNSSVVTEIPVTAASLAFPLLSFHNVGVWILYESAEYLENNPVVGIAACATLEVKI